MGATKTALEELIQAAPGYLEKESVIRLLREHLPLCEILPNSHEHLPDFYKESWRTDDRVIYIPDFKENGIALGKVHSNEELENTCSNLYSGKDFLNICNGYEDFAQKVFANCNGENPNIALQNILKKQDAEELLKTKLEKLS